MRIALVFTAGLAVGLALQTAIGQGYNRGLIAVNHVGLTVPDVEEAVAYYSDTLGFQEAFRANDDNGNARLVYMQVSKDTFVELNRANGRPTGINHLGIHVEDVEAAAAMFASAGAEVTEVRHSDTGAILANVMDLNGIRIELAELPPESDHRQAIDRWQ